MASGPQLSSRILDRYILTGEQIVVAARHHWGKILEPVATTAVALVVVSALASVTEEKLGSGVLVFWLAWLAVVARMLWLLLEWRNEWFVATDKRMLLVYGLITHKVAMMPLGKVTDMNYARSPLGRVLGYGQFLLESAGQDQAMRQIDWVAHPDATYLKLCDTLFGPGGADPADGPTAAPDSSDSVDLADLADSTDSTDEPGDVGSDRVGSDGDTRTPAAPSSWAPPPSVLPVARPVAGPPGSVAGPPGSVAGPPRSADPAGPAAHPGGRRFAHSSASSAPTQPLRVWTADDVTTPPSESAVEGTAAADRDDTEAVDRGWVVSDEHRGRFVPVGNAGSREPGGSDGPREPGGSDGPRHRAGPRRDPGPVPRPPAPIVAAPPTAPVPPPPAPPSSSAAPAPPVPSSSAPPPPQRETR